MPAYFPRNADTLIVGELTLFTRWARECEPLARGSYFLVRRWNFPVEALVQSRTSGTSERLICESERAASAASSSDCVLDSARVTKRRHDSQRQSRYFARRRESAAGSSWTESHQQPPL